MGLLRDFFEPDPIENDEQIILEPYGKSLEPSKYIKELEGLFVYEKNNKKKLNKKIFTDNNKLLKDSLNKETKLKKIQNIEKDDIEKEK